MTLPASGAISLSQVNVELGLAATTLISLNATNVRTLAGVASGAIGMNNLQGKTNNFAFTISTNQIDANLRTLAVAAGWNQVLPVVATIAAGVVISASAVGNYALTINGSWANGVKLVNNGTIVGRGGVGGGGGSGNTTSPVTATNGSAGSAGGPALLVSSGVSIDNTSGVIGGGGGGGGGGAGQSVTLTWGSGGNVGYARAGGGGGGGGAGAGTGGSGGATSVVNSTGGNTTASVAGSTAGATTNGAGGSGGTQTINNNGVNLSGFSSASGSAGGNGGTMGAVGVTAATTTTTAPDKDGATGGAGGAAGACLSGNVNITWIAFGSRLGAIT